MVISSLNVWKGLPLIGSPCPWTWLSNSLVFDMQLIAVFIKLPEGKVRVVFLFGLNYCSIADSCMFAMSCIRDGFFSCLIFSSFFTFILAFFFKDLVGLSTKSLLSLRLSILVGDMGAGMCFPCKYFLELCGEVDIMRSGLIWSTVFMLGCDMPKR